MNWHDLYGMETPRSQLGMAISSGRLGHAHILAGPEGSGRRTFALMVARHRLCENREADLHDATLASCGTCPSCKQVEAGNHPDCQTWTKPEEDKEFKIKIMRDLIENLSLKSTCGRGRIAIIEIKSSITDYRTDQQWQTYLVYCDEFAFAVALDFPRDLLPDHVGLIVAYRFGAQIMRPFFEQTLNANRRRAETLRFARHAALRLGQVQ